MKTPVTPEERFPDPKGDRQIEHQHAIVEAAYPAESSWPQSELASGAFGNGGSFLSTKAIPRKRDETHHGPADEVLERDAEIDPRIAIAVDLAEEPAIPAQGHWIDDDIDESIEQRR